MRQINRNIKHLRKSMRLTQDKFAVLVGIKRASVGSYEEDRAIPPADILGKIALACNVSVDELLYQKMDRQERFIEQNLPKKILEETRPIPNQKQEIDPLFASLPLFQFAEPKVEPRIEQKNTAPIYPKFDEIKTEPTRKSSSFLKDSIPYVSFSQIRKFTRETDLDSFGSTLPVLNFPFIPFTENTWAFDAPEDFVMTESVIISALLADYQSIKDGENYLIFFKNGEYLYRRIYNQIRLKGILLTNSDKSGIPSEEFRIENILYLFQPLSYISNSMPKPEAEVDAIRKKINELSNLIGDL
jgi:transcriptional regulator with XRE-family HTH domain